MTNSIKLYRDLISLESEAGTPPINQITDFFSSLQQSFSSFLSKLTTPNWDQSLGFSQSDFLALVAASDYIAMSTKQTSSLSGWASSRSYESYSSDLLKCAEHMTGIEKDLIKPFTVYVTRMINVKEQVLDTRSLHKTLVDFGDRRDALFTQINSYFDPKSIESKPITVSQMVQSHAQWNEVIKNTIKLNQIITDVNKNNLHQKIKTLNSYLEVLFADLQKRSESTNMVVTREVVLSLSEGVYQCGIELQAYALMNEKVRQFKSHLSDVAQSIYGAKPVV